MKVVFMGTPEFALPALQRLIASPHRIVLVVTQPDRPKGRGLKPVASPVHQLAAAHGLEIIQPVSVRREPIDERVRQSGADVTVVAAFGQILPRPLLEATRFGCLNIHPSLLPEFRGAAPVQRCLLEGRDTTGVTIMQLVEELDAGPIIAQQRVEILPDDDARSVLNNCAVIGADMLLRVLDEAERTGIIDSTPQNDEEATYAPPIRKEEGLIPWRDSTEEIMYRLRALTPWPGAYSFLGGRKRLTLLQAEPLWSNEAAQLGVMNKVEPGTVTSLKRGFGFTVKTGSGHLLVTALKPEGKNRMDGQAFVAGRGVSVGDKLGDPA
ncbi:MAG TPA: methionyl-tRNA formyltransferase [Candidatus Sumerlaeota bacterium]|nr:MAG: Methionyl-tRNA formyltransferase [candidate division BRC1 bacterium ADurb.BinA292]HOE97802.1 methionyl-tRNA formyltransferase [Candidatus Sumerlaeota bacterium]HOR29072.1 methionyl-tRNA formyltransferase [Candidatus Sumerlaeota bacterium]HPK04257.1 methionyl-tRNA formyltransferase [Candidatus Sumerlaeota bacterium]